MLNQATQPLHQSTTPKRTLQPHTLLRAITLNPATLKKHLNTILLQVIK